MGQQESITSVVLHGERVEWTRFDWQKTAFERADQRAVEGGPPADATPAERAEWLKTQLGPVKGLLTAVLHTDRVLLRVVELPSTDPAELAGMAELQVDKFSPFPVEHMAVSHEILSVSGDSARVLIAACKREEVESLGTLFAGLGRPPDRVDIVATGWWRLLVDARATGADGRHGHLLLDETGAVLVISQAGVPVLARSLGAPPAGFSESFCAELAEETGYTLTALESDWGAMATADLTVWHHDAPPAFLLERIGQESGVPVLARSLEELPPFSEGVARRSVEPGERGLDLSLPEWKTAAGVRRVRRRLVSAVAALVLLWFGALSALFLVSHLDRARRVRLEQAVAAMEGPAEEARLLQRRVDSLEQYADRTYSALEVLREITALLPEGVELTSFAYRKGGRVNLRGEAVRVTAIYDFFEALEASALFVAVTPEGVTQAPGGGRRPDFRLTAYLPGDES